MSDGSEVGDPPCSFIIFTRLTFAKLTNRRSHSSIGSFRVPLVPQEALKLRPSNIGSQLQLMYCNAMLVLDMTFDVARM